MNEKKICFIMCVNNKEYEAEALYYINRLHIPEGYSIDSLSVWGATGMAAGYNEGMSASDAKYKVYLHQDTMIIDKYFISKILNIFHDKTVGMIGMVGAPTLPDDYVMWHGGRIGRLYCCNVSHMDDWVLGEVHGEYQEVQAIDGFLMATQYDIPWRDDVFDKWDFYDVSQSFEFINAGHKVVVPNMKQPWCIHDAGFMNLDYYYDERDKFIKSYNLNSYYSNIRKDLVELITSDKLASINILEIGCGSGATLEYIKNNFPNSEVHGVEYVKEVAETADPSLNIVCGDVENMDFEYSPEIFDYIICGDVIEHLRYPEEVLKKLKPYLKPDGHILCSIPNLMHAAVIYELLRGNFTYQDSGILDRTHMRFFTANEIIRMFERLDFQIVNMLRRILQLNTTRQFEDFFNKLLSIEGVAEREQFDTFQYLVDVKKVERK
ncbi:MAG: methyltransferase domain-containing protein [Lachnospiraceae bacterium]|nr:methyltransferase domain-containing protein [Lachnospiraceae bacterium]